MRFFFFEKGFACREISPVGLYLLHKTRKSCFQVIKQLVTPVERVKEREKEEREAKKRRAIDWPNGSLVSRGCSRGSSFIRQSKHL